VEINQKAVRLFRNEYPFAAADAKIHLGSVEETLKKLKPVNVVYTMAFLMHIHPDSSHVFAQLVRLADDFLITVEEENQQNWCIWRRNYREVFEKLGMRQVAEMDCEQIKILDFGKGCFIRVFAK
jgi:hypothetical protein